MRKKKEKKDNSPYLERYNIKTGERFSPFIDMRSVIVKPKPLCIRIKT